MKRKQAPTVHDRAKQRDRTTALSSRLGATVMVGATAATALGAAALANTAKAAEVTKANQQSAQLATTQQPSAT
ncbi:MAG: hypothetical protein WCJ48_07085, partial [Actinomycetes bacterium]